MYEALFKDVNEKTVKTCLAETILVVAGLVTLAFGIGLWVGSY